MISSKYKKIGGNLSDEDLEYLKSIGIKEKSTTRKINFLGHIIIPNQLSTDTTKAEEEAFTLRKRMTESLARYRKILRLSIIGRANAANPSLQLILIHQYIIQSKKIKHLNTKNL